MTQHPFIAGCAGILLLCSAACVKHQPLEAEPQALVADAAFSQTGVGQPPVQWWESFNSSGLNSLVEEGLRQNHDLNQAWARLKQADAVTRRTHAARLGEVNLQANQFQSHDLSDDRPKVEEVGLGLNLSYQVDLWGRIAANTRAGEWDTLAARQDVASTGLVLTGQITELWLDLQEQHLALALLQRQAQTNRDYLKLVEARFAQGLAGATEVSQQRLQVAAVANRMPAVRAAIAQGEHRLAILLGRNPIGFSLQQTQPLPDLPEMPETGVPAQLLDRRPDVQAAAYRLFAADQRLLAARLERYPRLDLSAKVSGTGNDLSAALEQWAFNLTANLLQPLWDGGARKAEVQRTGAVTEERLLAWQKQILQAAAEVENTLAIEQTQLETLSGLEEQLQLAGQSLDAARKNYTAGVHDYLNVLTALQARQNLELELLRSQGDLLKNRVNLYLALGGDVTTAPTYVVQEESYE